MIGEISIFPDSHEVLVNEKVSISFTLKEYDVVYTLATNPNKIFSRNDLLEKVWGYDFEGDARTVDQHIKNIREKFKKAGIEFPIPKEEGLE